MFRSKLWLGVALAVLCGAAVPAVAEDKPADFKVDALKFRLSGPYKHDNLTVFLLHGKDQDDRDYLTLDQGLDKKLVVVSEKKQERVNELQIENKSDRYLFLQEGDRLQGGKQDRIIVTSLIVPPKTGPMPVPAFCIEQSRWRAGASGKQFDNVRNVILASQGVRAAAKGTPMRGGQGAVWREVQKDKAAAMQKLGSKNTNSSLNETLDSPEVKKICDACAKALNPLADKHSDVIGVAVAVNGKVEEVDVYPNHKLFARLYPRLVQSFAVQAALEKDKTKKVPAVAAAEVEKFMAGGKEKAKRLETINADNRMRVRDLEAQLECVTAYKGQVIHRQWLNRAALPPAPKQGPRNQQRNDNRPPRQQDNDR
jgi:hypothetical protein